jgi:hypothetical protein
MTMQYILPAVLAVRFFFCLAVPAWAEMKSQWSVQPRRHQAQAYMAYDDVTGQAPCWSPPPFGHVAPTLKLTEIWAKLGQVSSGRHGGYGQGCCRRTLRNDGADRDSQQGPRADEGAHQVGRCAQELMIVGQGALVGYCFGGAVGVEFGSNRCAARGECLDPARFATMRPDGRKTPGACS